MGRYVERADQSLSRPTSAPFASRNSLRAKWSMAANEMLKICQLSLREFWVHVSRDWNAGAAWLSLLGTVVSRPSPSSVKPNLDSGYHTHTQNLFPGRVTPFCLAPTYLLPHSRSHFSPPSLLPVQLPPVHPTRPAALSPLCAHTEVLNYVYASHATA